MGVFHTFKLYKWYEIAQRITKKPTGGNSKIYDKVKKTFI